MKVSDTVTRKRYGELSVKEIEVISKHIDIIIQATKNSIASILAGYTENLGKDIKEYNEYGDCLFYMLQLNENEICGTAIITSDYIIRQEEKSVHLSKLYISPECRGKNVASEFLSTIKKDIKSTYDNVEYLSVGVVDDNKRAINFYNKSGFVNIFLDMICKI